MRTIQRILPFLGFLGACFAGHAANHVVTANNSIQAAINAASTGDTVIIWQGVYEEDLVINGKALSLRPLNDASVQVRSVTANNAGGIVRLNKIRVETDVNATKSSLHLLKCYILGDVTVADAVDDGNNDLQAVILQTTIQEKLTCKAKRSWICYNTIRHSYLEGDTEVTGNEFDGRGDGSEAAAFLGIGIDVNGTATHARIRNNRIRNYRGKITYDMTAKCIGIRVNGEAKADIVNNLIFDCYDNGSSGIETDCGMGIFVQSTTGAKILGNAIWHCWQIGGNTRGDRLVYAPFANVILKNNLLWNSWAHVHPAIIGGGVVSYDSVTLPDYTATPFDADGHPTANFVGSNKGPTDAHYNDHDGTRNDIGMYGGHSYLINGRTTNKPIPLGVRAGPIAVPAGGIITIQSIGGTPK